MAVAGCDDPPPTAQTPVVKPQASAFSAVHRSWIEIDDKLPPAVWLASKEAGHDVDPDDPAAASLRALLHEADIRFTEGPRMVANRAVQVQSMLAERGVKETPREIIAGLVSIGEIGERAGFGETCQHYVNARAASRIAGLRSRRCARGLCLRLLQGRKICDDRARVEDIRHPFERARAATRSLGGASLRIRILALFASVNLACAMAAGVVTIFNAREATRVEITSSLDTAGRLARETVIRLERDVGRLRGADDLQASLPLVRHVRIVIEDAAGVAVAARDQGSRRNDDSERVPAWFSRLIEPPPALLRIPVTIAGRPAGTVVVHGDPSDEIGEVWDDLVSLLILFVVLNVLTIAVFALLIGRVLRPLGSLADGMADLRLGRLDRRLKTPKSRELAAIVERFNALGQALETERAKNGRMSWRMVSLQDDERRQIATELHDELGPCLFGLRANLDSLEREITSGPTGASPAALERLATVSELSVRLSDMNRRLLKRLRPMALGAAPLPDVLAGLMADFQRQHPERRFELATARIGSSYGEAVDLTVYRVVQEGVTNAIRHAACARVSVSVVTGRDEQGVHALHVRVLDDGGGVSEPPATGFGLIGLGERLRALGGSFHLHNVQAGAALDVVVPLAHAAVDRAIPGISKDRTP